MHIVDRRLNPGGKSLVNRQRFLRRARAYVSQAVRDSLKDRSIKDLAKEGEVVIRRDAIHEPTLRRGASGGNRERVLPGNKEFLEGDRIKRPDGSGGGGSQAGEGEDQDDFRFALSREEFLDLFLDDLELPDMAKKKLVAGKVEGIRRAGYATIGNPSNLSVPRTMQKAMSRRIALRRPSSRDLRQIDEAIAEIEARAKPLPDDAVALERLREERAHVIRRRNLIAYIDPVDLRYRRFEPVPRPVAQAVMFCLMDVSGSMTAHMKDLAKRFFALLHLFLSRCYEHVEVVFIHHTDRAAEVDEETFFYSTVTGGTLVSSALDKMMEVVKDRYNPNDWNIYVAQASDGDTLASDNARVVSLMQDEILPIAQYVAYLEVGREEFASIETVTSTTGLWDAYAPVGEANPHFAMRKVSHRREIYPVFRELFQRRGMGERTRA
ncbi:MAG TPA: YeaH/YhbH family protein [Sphingobium sp.]|nr:YeaH/YhbH family protein [Sphingobium sp.]